jgi:hypothetical protein
VISYRARRWRDDLDRFLPAWRDLDCETFVHAWCLRYIDHPAGTESNARGWWKISRAVVAEEVSV